MQSLRLVAHLRVVALPLLPSAWARATGRARYHSRPSTFRLRTWRRTRLRLPPPHSPRLRHRVMEIVFKGQALPNSFITLYIYSTPIVVTVKTDSKGEWQYVLDKELENGDHTIYTATVNNSGNIIAKSSPYLFTKTAEAATLKDFPFTESSMDTNKPGLLEDNNIYLIIIFILAIVIMTLILIGITNKKS